MQKLRVQEAVVLMRERSEGSSMHAGLRPVIYVIKMLFSIFIIMLSAKQIKRYGK